MQERNERKVVFDEIASEYDAMRPGYPEQLIEKLLLLSNLQKSAHILEVGCGTGQATRSFARREFKMTCIDISPALLTIAQENFQEQNNVRFVQTPFEEYDEGNGLFDLILSATSWHWIDPEVRYQKASQLLKPGGRLVVLANLYPQPYCVGFFKRAQDVYSAVVPEWGNPDSAGTTMDTIRKSVNEMEASGIFHNITVCEEEWEQVYSRDEYCRLISTYSDHHRLGKERLSRLLEGLGTIIDEEYKGQVVKPYTAVAYIGKLSSQDRS